MLSFQISKRLVGSEERWEAKGGVSLWLWKGSLRPVPPQYCAEAACCETLSVCCGWLWAGCSSDVYLIWSLRGGRCLLAWIWWQFRQEIGVSLLQALLGMCHSRTGASWRTKTRPLGNLDWAAPGGGLWWAHVLQLAVHFYPDPECLAGLRARRTW